MATNNFNSDVENDIYTPLMGVIDNDGIIKLDAPSIASHGFDGAIPVVFDEIVAELIEPGMFMSFTGNDDGQPYYQVIGTNIDDVLLQSETIVTITYLDQDKNIKELEADITDTYFVIYEDWDNKDIGTIGWYLTNYGNAIFTNVAVRGRIEAEEGYISGTLTIGSGGATTIDDLATSSDLDGYIPDGYAASDIISNSTTITGGNISTGTIQSQNYNYTSGNWSNYGVRIGLDGNGYYRSPNLYIDTSGNAYFRGRITASAGYFGPEGTGVEIFSEAGRSGLRTSTLELASELYNGQVYGGLAFTSSAGVQYGTLSTTSSSDDKDIRALGEGLLLGTYDDFYFVPGTGNSRQTRIKTQGLDFVGGSDQFLLRANNNGLGVANGLKFRFYSSNPSLLTGTDGTEAAYAGYNSGSDTLTVSNSGGTIDLVSTNLYHNGSPISGGGSSIPVGTIWMYGGATVPSGWIFCNGQSLSTTGTYSSLFSVIGYEYGGGGSTFNAPDFTQRFPRGGTNNDASRGNTGGAATYTLTESNIPRHNHSGSELTLSGETNDSGAAAHSGSMGSKGAHTHSNATFTADSQPSHTHGLSSGTITGSTGNGGSHSHTYIAPDAPGTNNTTGGTGSVVKGRTSGTSTSNEPSHSHGSGTLALGGSSGSAGAHGHTITVNWSTGAGDHQHSLSVDSHPSHAHGAGSLAITGDTGNYGQLSPTAIDTLPPYVVVNFIIKY